MEPGSVFLLIVVFFVAIFLGVVQLQSEEELKNLKPTSTSELPSLAQLSGTAKWTVTIMRRSGYVYDEWEITGSAKNAIQLGISKLHQARIYDVHVRENSLKKLDVIAFYESQGSRRTGKYIGGFIIQSVG
jgi:hypothetical protein